MPEPRSPPALQPADYEDMRAQTLALADRVSAVGLSHIAYALEVVVVLLDDAEAAGCREPLTSFPFYD